MHPFEAMAEPARRRIVDILASGEHTAGQLAAIVGGEYRISRTAVSKHLGVLRDAQIVDVRADQSWRWYRLSSTGIGSLERAVKDLRKKLKGAIGWDAENNRKFDPLAVRPRYQEAVRRRGPGRGQQRGQRGRQRAAPLASDPEHGLYPIVPVPDDVLPEHF